MPDLVFELHTSYKLLYPVDSSSITVKSTLLEIPVSTGTGLLAYIRSYVLFLVIFLIDFICFKKNLLIKFGPLQSGRIKQQFTASLNSDKGSSVEFIYKGEIDNLLQIISKYHISKLLIEELDLEEIFIHYYE